MKIKKTIPKYLFTFSFVLLLFSFPSYAEQKTNQTEDTAFLDKNIEEMNLGEIVNELKSLDKSDIENIKTETDKIELKKEAITVNKEPLKNRILNTLWQSLAWLAGQIYHIRYRLSILLVLYIILTFIQKKGGGNDAGKNQK